MPATLHRDQFNSSIDILGKVAGIPMSKGRYPSLAERSNLSPKLHRQYVTESEIKTKSAKLPLYELPIFHTASMIPTPQAPKLTSKSPLGI